MTFDVGKANNLTLRWMKGVLERCSTQIDVIIVCDLLVLTYTKNKNSNASPMVARHVFVNEPLTKCLLLLQCDFLIAHKEH